MKKEIYKDGKLEGYIENNSIYKHKYGDSYDKVGVLSYSKWDSKGIVYDRWGKKLADIKETPYGCGYKVYENDRKEIIISSLSNSTIKMGLSKLTIEDATAPQLIAAGILLLQYETINISIKEDKTETKRVSKNDIENNYKKATITTVSGESLENIDYSAIIKWIVTIAILGCLVGGYFLVNLIIHPKSKFIGMYYPTNQAICETDSQVLVNGSISLELNDEYSFHLKYNFTTPSSEQLSIWGSWREENGKVLFDYNNIYMKDDGLIYVKILFTYYQNEQLQEQYITLVLRKE